jgi:hypothetical protein
LVPVIVTGFLERRTIGGEIDIAAIAAVGE